MLEHGTVVTVRLATGEERVLALLEKWDKDKEGKPEAEAAVFTSCIRDLTKALYPNRVEEEE